MILTLLDDLARVAAGTTAEQYALPTPSGGFDVRRLRQHLTGGLIYFDSAFGDPAAEERGADPHAYSGPDQLEAVIARLSATLRSALAAGVETSIVNVPHLGGAFPGSVVLDMLLIEVITHGWDLAVAAGLPWNPDEATAERALAFYRATIKPEWRGPGMAFGPEHAVSPDASPMERVVAFAGRDPGWLPATRR
ncbi:TIGR03086 family metal-binding protein [Actinoplanes solisilvae]|uniref:TIGR03086 family metal-binding protein n=1 Tax=Actinoplanes solisilvae TaxID=2486853 RepID=UPI00196A8A64|nr:TIGR03086 family metal-binding protein [Actinoplanes solisilvae]